MRIGKDWRAWLATTDIPKTTAYRLLEIARLPVSQVGHHTSEASAIEAVREAEKPRPAPVVEPSESDPPAVTPEVVDPEDDPAAVVESVAREAEPDREAEREAAAERLALRLQDEDGEVVDVLNRKLDAKDERHHRDVRTIKATNRRANATERKYRDVGDFIAAHDETCGCCREVLARFYNAQRRGAA